MSHAPASSIRTLLAQLPQNLDGAAGLRKALSQLPRLLEPLTERFLVRLAARIGLFSDHADARSFRQRHRLVQLDSSFTDDTGARHEITSLVIIGQAPSCGFMAALAAVASRRHRPVAA